MRDRRFMRSWNRNIESRRQRRRIKGVLRLLRYVPRIELRIEPWGDMA